MLIDWFTVSAQIVNFLVLVWLLKRYLYRPVLAAIDAREAEIASKLAAAQKAREEAERERSEAAAQRATLEQQRHSILVAAEGEARDEATRLLASAETERVERRKTLLHELDIEALSYRDEIIRRIRGEIIASVRQVLRDLASASLEQSAADAFLRRLDEVPATTPRNGHQHARLRCPFPLPAAQQERFDAKVRERFGISGPTEIEPRSRPGLGVRPDGGRSADRMDPRQLPRILRETPRRKIATGDKGMNNPPAEFQCGINQAFAEMDEARREFAPSLKQREIGTLLSITSGIARVAGLPNAGFEELVLFPGDVAGIVFNVDADALGVVLLGDYEHLRAGDEVERTGRVLDTPVGDSLLGRVVDPLGRALDEQGLLATGRRLPIERPAPAIMDRLPVTVPLQTGIKVIDALIPIGRGQRELLVGDRQTGKTAIAIDAILNQRDQNVLCIYCAIGQRTSSVAKVIAQLKEAGALAYSVVVVAEGRDAPGLSYIAPYAATSMAEYFMSQGRDVLIVYDDLTAHARAYREISLLLRRAPGREAFPGDIFYIHSRLLERATRLRPELGGGSLTALPIIETESQNISAYIPTNLISITDGQIYLSPTLFELGQLPAVDVGKSVSRVGGKAQRSAYHSISGSLKLAYAQFSELETFARFGTRLDEGTRKTITHGERIRACLGQPQSTPLTAAEQVMVLIALVNDFFDSVPLKRMAEAQQAVAKAAAALPQALRERIQHDSKWPGADRDAFLAQAQRALAPFVSTTPGPPS